MDPSDWLDNVDDPPLDLRLFDDNYQFPEWTTVDQDPDPDPKDTGPGSKSNQPHGLPVTPAPKQESSTPMQQNTTAQDAPAQGTSIATQACPDHDHQIDNQWQTFQDQDPNFYQQWPESSDLFNSNNNQDPDLTQYHYPDPQDYTNAHNAYLYPAEATPQQHLPDMSGFRQQQQQWHHGGGQMFVPQQTDFSFSPPEDFATPLFPVDDYEETPQPQPRKGKGRAVNPPASESARENPICIDCGKKYRTSTSPGRCTRCGAKYERRVAKPCFYTLDPAVPDYPTARRQIFSPITGRNVYQDDVHRYTRDPSAENRFVQRLLDSINVVQSREEGWDTWSVRQQKTFNEKAKLETGYSNALVTARLRALYREVLNYHLGGDAVYAVGGDNSGYADDRTLRFSQRMGTICEILRKNKRVVMDVVEGRGVQGFVSNPRKYHDRKASNNNCNVEKKRIMEKGKEIEAEMGSVVSKGKRARGMSPEPVEDVGEGPSEKRVRVDGGDAYSPEFDGGGYGPGKPMQAQWLGRGGRRG